MRGAMIGTGLAVALLVGACGGTEPSPSPSSPAQSIAASQAVVSPPATAAGTIPMPSNAEVKPDPGLMTLLPATVAGVPVTQEPDSLAEAVKDQAFVASVDRAAFPIAVSGNDVASGVIAHLRAGVYSDRMFADWRASYDEGACASSSGIVAHAQQASGGRTTYVTTCGGGLRVYHTYLASKGVVVSLLSTGQTDLGGQLMGQLQG